MKLWQGAVIGLLLASCTMPRPSSPNPPTFLHGVNINEWLAQAPSGEYGRADRFTKADMAWIAKQGYDHIRLPVDGRLLTDSEGRLLPERLAPIDRTLAWARRYGLGVILDLHVLEGMAFYDDAKGSLIFSDEALQQRAENLWNSLAFYYATIGPRLRFELLNEPRAPTASALNALQERLLAAVRKVSPERYVYLTSNESSAFYTINKLHVVDDPHVGYSLHFYEPYIFTHQRASWTDIGKYYNVQVDFPTVLTNLDRYFPSNHWVLAAYNGKRLDETLIADAFARVGDWAKTNRVEVLVSEFGVFHMNGAPHEACRRWIRAVRDACRREGFGWTVWDYSGGFGIRDGKGKPTIINEALWEK